MTALRSVGKSLCSPRQGGKPARNSVDHTLASEIDASCTARPPPLPYTGYMPPAPVGTAPSQSATKCRTSGTSPRDVPLLPRQPLPIVPPGSLPINASSYCQVSSTGSLGGHCYQSNASASSLGSVGTGSVSDVGGGSRPTSRRNSTGSPGHGSSLAGIGRAERAPTPRYESESVEEVQADNLKLQREVEQLREQLLVLASGSNRSNGTASANKCAVGGGFRGSAIRSGEKRGKEVTEKELETLRLVVQQKNGKIVQMEELLRNMQADGASQEHSLFQLQQSLANASHQLLTTDAQREELANNVEQLNKQLEGERDRIIEVQKSAAEISAGNEELSNTLLLLKAQLQAKSTACNDVENRAADLKAELSSAVARAGDLKMEFQSEQANAQRYLQQCLSDKRELHQQYLIALSLRNSVLQLCWEAWMQKLTNRRDASELERLRREASENEELVALRSAEHRQALYAEQGEWEVTVSRLEASAEKAGLEIHDLRTELRDRWVELQARSTKLSEVETSMASIVNDTARMQHALDTSLEAAHEHKTAELALSQRFGEFESSESKAQRDVESRLRGDVQDLRNELRDAKAAKDAQARQSSEIREASAAREAALKTRAAELEKSLRALESMAQSIALATLSTAVPVASSEGGGRAEDISSEREKRIQREETLLRELRRVEQDRDEARSQLQRMEQRMVPKRPTGGPNATRSLAARTCSSPGSPGKKSAIATTDVNASALDKAGIAESARAPELEHELATEREMTMQLRQECEELKAQRDQKQDVQLEAIAKVESTEIVEASKANLEQAREEAVKLRGDLSEASLATGEARREASDLRAELSEVRDNLSLERVDMRRLRKAREDLESSLKSERGEAKKWREAVEDAAEQAKKWREAVGDALEQVQKSVRILVTAPKVSINIGSTELTSQKGAIPQDIQKIHNIVNERVMPGFQRILAVAEEDGENEIRGSVLCMVEELAGKVQQEVYRVLPQAEGTASWDGFGSKASSLK